MNILKDETVSVDLIDAESNWYEDKQILVGRDKDGNITQHFGSDMMEPEDVMFRRDLYWVYELVKELVEKLRSSEEKI